MKNSHPEYDDDVSPTFSKCEKCGGRGVVFIPGSSPPKAIRCECSVYRDLVYTMENGWVGLSKANNIDESILENRVNKNLLITAPLPVFREHMKYVAMRMGYRWHFKVTSDSDLVNIWLSKLSDVKDPDYREPPIENNNLNRFVLLPLLLVIQLGVKVASNKETPSVVQEVVSLRYLENKPTWIVDQPYNKLKEGHKAYSRQLMDSLSIYEYKKLVLSDVDSGPSLDEDDGIVVGKPQSSRDVYDSLLNRTKTQKTTSILDIGPKKKKFSGGNW